MNENDEKEKKEQKKILKDSIKTLIGTEIFRLGIHSLLVQLGLSTYLISYLRFFQDKRTLTLQHSYFFRLTVLLVMNILGIFTPYIQKKIGFKIVLFFTGVSGTLFYLILYLSTNYYLSLCSHFLGAVSFSFSLLIERNLIFIFSKK
jgi:Na+/melibiose symporter-like transporter